MFRFLSQERKEKETANVFRVTGVTLEMKKTNSNVLEMISVNSTAVLNSENEKE